MMFIFYCVALISRVLHSFGNFIRCSVLVSLNLLVPIDVLSDVSELGSLFLFHLFIYFCWVNVLLWASLSLTSELYFISRHKFVYR
jgi:hypothetical protein